VAIRLDHKLGLKCMLDTELVATLCKIGVNSTVSVGQQLSPEAKPEANVKGPLVCHRRTAKSGLWPCWRLLSGPCGCCSPPCGGPLQSAVCAPSQAAQAQATCTKTAMSARIFLSSEEWQQSLCETRLHMSQVPSTTSANCNKWPGAACGTLSSQGGIH